MIVCKISINEESVIVYIYNTTNKNFSYSSEIVRSIETECRAAYCGRLQHQAALWHMYCANYVSLKKKKKKRKLVQFANRKQDHIIMQCCSVHKC